MTEDQNWMKNFPKSKVTWHLYLSKASVLLFVA